MRINIIAPFFTLLMCFQSSAYAQGDILAALNLSQGAGLLSAVPILGAGLSFDALPRGGLTEAAAPLLAGAQSVAPLIELLPVSQLIVPAAPVIGLVVSDLPVGTIAAQGIAAGVMFSDLLMPGSASFNSLLITIIGF